MLNPSSASARLISEGSASGFDDHFERLGVRGLAEGVIGFQNIR
jgi:hypothetical protein